MSIEGFIRRGALAALVSGLALLAVPVAHASGGRIPVYQAGTLITQPGAYYLAQDIEAMSGYAIRIATDDVDLDLAGHIVRQAAATPAIRIENGVDGVTVRNGRIAGGTHAVDALLSDGASIILEDLHVSGTSDVALNITASQSSSRAVAVVRRNTITRCGGGITLQYVRGEARDNVIGPTTGTDPGILASYCDGCVLADNTLSNMNVTGITVQHSRGFLVSANSVANAGEMGIAILGDSYDGTIERNVVSRAVGALNSAAIYSSVINSSGIRVVGNVASGSTTGIRIGASYALVDGNLATGNTNEGLILLAYGTVYSNNRVMSNGKAANVSDARDGGGNFLN